MKSSYVDILDFPEDMSGDFLGKIRLGLRTFFCSILVAFLYWISLARRYFLIAHLFSTRSKTEMLISFLRDRGQHEREAALSQFTKGDCLVCVGTDVAARGLDISTFLLGLLIM